MQTNGTMEPLDMIGGQALYRFRPTIANLTILTAIMIAPNYLGKGYASMTKISVQMYECTDGVSIKATQ